MSNKESLQTVFGKDKYLGKKFNMLTAIEYIGFEKNKRIFKFKCDCGKVTTKLLNNVKNGHTQSCGCLWELKCRDLSSRNGASKHPYWSIYKNMLSRCYEQKTNLYHRYGGRGIKVCDRWRHDFFSFVQDVGKQPSNQHTLDRIDNDGDYEPGNIKWSTRIEQASNTCTNVYVDFKGEMVTLSEAARRLGVTPSTTGWRLRNWGSVWEKK